MIGNGSWVNHNYLENIAFRGQRDDHNLVRELLNDKGSIIPTKDRQIKQALKNISENGSSSNIEFLLSVAKDLKYGYIENSPLGEFLSTKSDISDKAVKQNTDWGILLKSSIESAIQKNTSAEKSIFEKELLKIFPKEENQIKKGLAWVSTNPDNQLFLKQAELVKLRDDILNSKEFNGTPENLSKKEIEDLSRDKLAIKRNLDYFLASSESPISEKIESLKQFSHFMSDDYKINEQLKDKKVKVLSEIVNDIIIKSPEQQMLTIKNVDQRKHGMCAAISICRKALAYEDKTNYIKTLLSELDNSPEMEVFDVTNLDRQTKIPVKKTNIDFDAALKDGYRIIDASALQWMHISDTIGNGEFSVGKYTAFDHKNYGIFHDAKWYNDLPKDQIHNHNYLRTLIKAKEDQQRIEKKFIKEKLLLEEVRLNKNNYVEITGKAYGQAEQALESILPDEEKKKISSIAKKLINIENLENEKFKVHPKDEEQFKKFKIRELIKSESIHLKEDNIDAAINKIYSSYLTVKDVTDKQEKAKSLFSPAGKAGHYKDLFILAANNRICTEVELDNPERIEDYCNSFDIPDKQQLLKEHINNLTNDVKKSNSDQKLSELASKLNVNADKTAVLEKLENLDKEVYQELPKQTDNALIKMGFGDRKKVLSNVIDNVIININNGNQGNLNAYSMLFKVPPNKDTIVTNLKNLSKELQTDIPEKRLAEIFNKVGYKDQTVLAKEYYSILCTALEQGVSQEAFDSIAKNLGAEAEEMSVYQALDALNKDLDKISQRYDEIADITKMPSSKDLVLKKLEKSGDILPRKTLDDMQAKFDEISNLEKEKEIAKREGKKLKNPDIYKFNNEHLRQFEKIKTDFSKLKKATEREYKTVNTKLAPYLEELYGEIGRQKGHFWLPEEGHSGLYGNEQIRIFEQMTGRPHYAESNIDEVVDYIKKTGKSGISSMNVSYDEYSGHAQYIADIKDAPVFNANTGKIEKKEAIWHDNSWGPVEKDKFWKDFANQERTSYGKSYGGERGFLLDADSRTGTFVEDIVTKFGVNNPTIPDNKKLRKLSDGAGDRFPIFHDVVLDGYDPKLYIKSMSLIDKVIEHQNNKPQIQKFVNYIQNNANSEINIKKLENMDEFASITEDKLINLIKGSSSDKGIETIEDFNKLPENHKLKVLLRKISLIDNMHGYAFFKEISAANTHHQLDPIEKEIINSAKLLIVQQISDFNANPDSIRSVMDLKENLPFSEELIKWIDKKFNPANDSEMLEQFKNLKKMNKKDLTRLLNESTTEELGIKLTDPYSIIQKIRAEQHHAEKSLHKAVLYDTIYNRFNFESTNLAPGAEKISEMDKIYRNFYITLSNLDTKAINKYKTLFFDKYQVRPAFPQINLSTKNEISEAAQKYLTSIQESTEIINGLNNKLEIYDLHTKIEKAVKIDDQTPKELVNAKVIPLLDELQKKCKNDDIFSKESLKIEKWFNAVGGLKPTEQLGANLSNQLNKILLDIKAIKTEYPPSLIKEKIQESKSGVGDLINWMTKANIEPKYQTKIAGMTRDFIRNTVKNPDSEANINLYKNLLFEIEEKYILNSPTEILHSVIKVSKDKVGNKEANKQILGTLSSYLEMALNAGKLTEVEYEIIKNAQTGVINKMKLIMSSLSLHSMDGNTSYPLSTPNGMRYLMNNLLDPVNDNRTLKLFLESTGLSEQAASTIMTGNGLKREQLLFDLYSERIKKHVSEFKKLDKMEKVFTQKITKECKYTKVSEVFDDFMRGIDKNIIKSDIKRNKFLDIYKNALKESIESVKDNPVDSNIVKIIKDAHTKSAEVGYSYVSELIYKLNCVVSELRLKNNLLGIVNISEKSKMFLDKKNYQENLFKALLTMSKGVAELNKILK